MDADEAIKRWAKSKIDYDGPWEDVEVTWTHSDGFRYSEYTAESGEVECVISVKARVKRTLTGTFDFGEIVRDLVAFAVAAE